MKDENIIYKTKPSFFNPYAILVLIFIGLNGIFIADNVTSKVLMGGTILLVSTIFFIKKYNENTIEIKKENIELIKPYPFKNTKKECLNFSEIECVKYNRGGYKQESAIYLKTHLKSNIKVLIPNTSFEFGHVLKFLKSKGIEINLVHSDQELRMYIDGQIEDFPMTNDTEVKVKKKRII